AVDTHDLHVRPLGKARIRLEARSNPSDLVRIAADDCVRVAHGNRYELDAVDALRRTGADRAERLLDVPVVEHARLDVTIADANAHTLGARELGEPPRGDARAVSGHLGRRSIGI